VKKKTRRAPRKLVILETYWSDHGARAFRSETVQPFFQGLSSQLDPALRIAHRFVESPAQLEAYTRRKGGLLWSDVETFDTPVYYLSFHGSPGRLRTALARLGPARLCGIFRDWGRSYDNLVYFAACSVLEGERGRSFAQRFLEHSGCRAVVGYTSDVDWIESMLTDLLFLKRFYAHPDPWNNLRAIHESVLIDFAPAHRLGFTLHARD
jgi:hypothetical protein